MKILPGWRRLAEALSLYAAAVLPDASPWTRAMRRELDYIEDDRAALRWALGCVVASHKAAWAARTAAGLGRLRRLSCGRNPILLLRHAAASGALMLAVGLALLENAGGQTPPPIPDETACDIADKAADFGPDARGRMLPSGPPPAARASEKCCAGRGVQAPETPGCAGLLRSPTRPAETRSP